MAQREVAGRPILFGEVLHDHFPDGSKVLGGAPFNVAWHLQGLGMSPIFVSRVGADPDGESITTAMRGWGMDLQGLQIDEVHPTGTVQVSLRGGEPSYEILADQAYDHIDADSLPDGAGASLLYHGSLALRAPASRAACERLAADGRLARLVDINLRPPWWQRDSALALLQGATWAKLNEHELAELGAAAGDPVEQAAALQARCGIELLVVTLGAAGAMARTADGEVHEVRPAAGPEPVDTVGAGDAFTAVSVYGLNRGWPVATVLERAQDFASSIVGRRGATVSDPGFYDGFLRHWGEA